MNCIENLPVFAAIVFCVTAAQAEDDLLNFLALAVLGGRICQTTVHLAFVQTNIVAAVRFAFFLIQALCMLGMTTLVVIAAAG
jgi:uncharacterized MAPEG superfamily protein